MALSGLVHLAGMCAPDVDAVRISQVLSNLLSNAAKYTPASGRIAIDVVAEQGSAIIRVNDTGIGIAREALEGVFEMFAQAPHSIGISKGGLGIGLSLVRHLVTLHGGNVVATSPGPGQGSTFVVRLPLADVGGRNTLQTTSSLSDARSTIGRRLRILVADDNADAADTLVHVLRAKGHDVRMAYDGQAAVQAAAAFLPELAFLDIGMPGMDGYQVATALRASAGTTSATLVALTGWGAAEDRARSRAAGFDLHLLKPAAPEDVDAVLASSGDEKAGQQQA
jgi:CheY-like chemotaxis protein